MEKKSFINTETMKENDLESILDEVTNRHTYNEQKTKYFVGFPWDVVTHDSPGAQGSTNDTPIYDQQTTGSIQFLETDWSKKFCDEEYIENLESHENWHHNMPNLENVAI